MSSEQAVREAARLSAAGRPGEAIALLQRTIADEPPSAGSRDARSDAFTFLLGYLYEQGRDARAAKVLRQYIAEFCDLRDARFDDMYLEGLRATNTCPVPLKRRNRYLLLIQQLERVLSLAGSVAECGCARGLSSYLMCSSIKRHDPAFSGAGYEIYDSFQGLSEPQSEDQSSELEPTVAADMKLGAYAVPLAKVQRALSAFPGIEYFPGWIPQAFDPARTTRYRLVHVDVDLYQPTLDSFEYFWPRLVPGGVIVCDDYNWPGARRAVEEFCAAKGIRYEVTPYTQAYFSRPA